MRPSIALIVYSHIPDATKPSCAYGPIPRCAVGPPPDHEVYATGHCTLTVSQITVDYLLIHSADTMRGARSSSS